MADVPEDLRAVHRKARAVGLACCIAGPLVLLGLAATGVLAPGTNAVAGLSQQVGYTFTGLVFLAAAWMTWRKGRILRSFGSLAPGVQPRILLRESLLYTALSATSALWGTLYWMLVGWNAIRHVLAFLLLTPAMFLFLVPDLGTWVRALKEDAP